MQVHQRYYRDEDFGDSYSVALYTVPEVGFMRETFNRTAQHAMASPRFNEVVPFVALGTGQRRTIEQVRRMCGRAGVMYVCV